MSTGCPMRPNARLYNMSPNIRPINTPDSITAILASLVIKKATTIPTSMAPPITIQPQYTAAWFYYAGRFDRT